MRKLDGFRIFFFANCRTEHLSGIFKQIDRFFYQKQDYPWTLPSIAKYCENNKVFTGNKNGFNI